MIERKAGWLIDKHTKEALIDEDIIRTLLKIPRYQHGIRSMEAIIDMSMLEDKDFWSKSDLPPTDQLSIHIEEKDIFKKLIILFTQYKSYRENMAKAIHSDYLEYMEEERKKTIHRRNCRMKSRGKNFPSTSEMTTEVRQMITY